MMYPNHKPARGFSLVEISIVIVIIALVIGGVYVGQDMVSVSKGNRTISDMQNYKTVYDQFKSKYESLPGDMADATYYWSTSVNGNGNWRIEEGNEPFVAWQHFTLAGYINEEYTGSKSTPAGQGPLVGQDLPGAPYNDSGYTFSMENFTGQPKPVLNLGGPSPAGADSNLLRGILTPQEAATIDSKIDDGVPSGGILRARDGASAVSTCSVAASYTSANQNKDCLIYYLLEGAKND